MNSITFKNISRRRFLKTSATAAAGITILPSFYSYKSKPKLMTRDFGRLNHEVTTFGLGGQASIQWTPDDVDPVAIILKAFDRGVNYFDTSNLYGPSQTNYGKAFRNLSLIPGIAGYNENLRKSIFLTSKTHLRIAKGSLVTEGVNNWSNGPEGSHTVDDLKRSLSQIFGDGKGNYPKGAYLDMVLIHSVTSRADVDAVFEGLENTDPKAERIGALAALRDYRDGTNFTGLNPGEEKLINHIGFSGHFNAGVMMEMIRRDKYDILDGLLVAINANDKLNFNMQNNVIPVAAAKNMGIIGMKVFADGAMYSKGAHWSGQPSHVVRQIGSKEMPFKPLIEYSLTTSGINASIIGIGQISDDPSQCQLSQNIAASQIKPDSLSESERLDIERMANFIKDGKTNYFQMEEGGLTAPQNAKTEILNNKEALITWDTAYAGDNPIDYYEIWRNNNKIGQVQHQPQISSKPFQFKDNIDLSTGHVYRYEIFTVDKKGRKSESGRIQNI
jgi:aryl-alcohol dehydrogenase-like predicted oxidoreductase